MSDNTSTGTYVMEKETKNAVRYTAKDKAAKDLTGMVYVNKSALPEEIPEEITLTVAW